MKVNFEQLSDYERLLNSCIAYFSANPQVGESVTMFIGLSGRILRFTGELSELSTFRFMCATVIEENGGIELELITKHV